MKRVKHFLLASCLFPTLLGAQEMASAYFLELTPDAQSAGMAGTGLATTDNGSTAIFHNASTIAFSQEVMGASYSYAKINQDYALHSASLFYRIGREGIHGFAVGFRHFKDPKVLDYRPHVWDLEAAYFRNVAKNLSLSLTFRYLQAKAAESADSKNSVCLDLLSQYGSIGRNGFLEHWFPSCQLRQKAERTKVTRQIRIGRYNRPAIQYRKPFAGGARLQLSAPF